jgi:hypothetical protein
VSFPETTHFSSLLVIELSRTRREGHVRLVLSLPGREGTVERHWGLPGQQGVTPGQLEDILASLAQTVTDWIMTSGVQQTMF